MKRFLAITLCLVTLFSLTGCDMDSTQEEKDYQEQLMQQSNDMVGMPEITNFFNKKMLKEIYEKCDDSDLVCYAYSQNLDGYFVYVGKCMGYGIPYSTQYTNPEKYEYSGATLPQADPDGLYRPDGLSATWLMMIDEESGEPYIMYCEPTIVVTEHKLPKRLIDNAERLPKDY